jgi:hypothetical protein
LVPADDWQPTDRDLAWAIQRFPKANLIEHIGRFILKSQAKGYAFVDIGAGWRAWLAEDMSADTSATTRRTAARLSPASHVRFDAWAAAAQASVRPN